MQDPFNHRIRVCFPWGRSEGVTVFETSVAFQVAWKGYAMFSGVREQSGRRETCAESSGELELQPQ